MNNIYREIPATNFTCEIKTVSMKKLKLDIDIFINNDIIIVESGTGTGKTELISENTTEINEKCNTKIISLVNLISLARQQLNSFVKEDVNLKTYQNGVDCLIENNGVICINSLYKLIFLKDFDPSDKILYIDECNDLIRSLTHNDNMSKVLTMTYDFLIELIKNCKKIIITDATINQNTLNLISTRKTNNKTILIKNTYKKFSGINATKYNSYNAFLERLRFNIKNNKYFLCGCDGCEKITEIYKLLLDEFKDNKNKFILVTSKVELKVLSANKQFLDMFVFYSPSITTGVSFVNALVAQDHFMYLTNRPLITPDSFYQMSCRTRNMKQLHYFVDKIEPKPMEHETLKEIENKYKQMKKLNNRLSGLSMSRNENDENKIVANTFFKLLCYNDYLDEIFRTDFIKHYENRLQGDGFVLETIGQKDIDKVMMKINKDMYELQKSEDYEEYITKYFMELETEEQVDENEIYLQQNPFLRNNLDLLNILTAEDALKYRHIISDQYMLKEYFSFLNLYKTKDYINEKFKEYKQQTFDEHILKTSINSVKLLEQFESHYKIERLNFDIKQFDPTKEIDKDFQILYKQMFPKQKEKSFKTKLDIYKVYRKLIVAVTGENLGIIKVGKKARIDDTFYRPYILNIEKVKDLIELCKFRNQKLKQYNTKLIEKHTNIKPSKFDIRDTDENELYNNFQFDKTFHKN